MATAQREMGIKIFMLASYQNADGNASVSKCVNALQSNLLLNPEYLTQI
jgi:hypothetical protein